MSQVTGQIMQALTAIADEVTMVAHGNKRVMVQYAILDKNVSGNNEIVAAQAGKFFVVLAYNIMSNGGVNTHFRSASTPVSGTTFMDAASKGKVASYNPKGWFKTATGEALNLHLSASIAVGGELVYAVLEA